MSDNPSPAGAGRDGRLQEIIARVLWSKVTEIGGGKCYLRTNLDDVASEIAAALAVPDPLASSSQDVPNIRLFRAPDGTFFVYNGEGSGNGDTPEAAMREWVRSRNTDAQDSWPLTPLASSSEPQGEIRTIVDVRCGQRTFFADLPAGDYERVCRAIEPPVVASS